MSTQVLRGKPIADAIGRTISEDIRRLALRDIHPKLAVVCFGERPGDLSYERGLRKRCEAFGLEMVVYRLAENVAEEEFADTMKALSSARDVHGILPLRPIPEQFPPEFLKHSIHPGKDVDCVGPHGSAAIFDRDLSGFFPCTAEAVLDMLHYYDISIAGKRSVVIGRSLVVGRPLALLLLDEHSTVTVCHSRTVNLPEVAREADLLICAIGRSSLVTADFVKPGAVVIDIGINDNCAGGICGDVDYDSVVEVAGAITPVPGGVGAVTNSILVRNVVKACMKMEGISDGDM